MKKTIITMCLLALLPTVAGAGSIYKQTYGCRSTASIEKLGRLAGDSAAFGKELAKLAMSGECLLFTGGEQVVLTDHSWSAGATRLHLAGDPAEYWVNSEYVNAGR